MVVYDNSFSKIQFEFSVLGMTKKISDKQSGENALPVGCFIVFTVKGICPRFPNKHKKFTVTHLIRKCLRYAIVQYVP